MLSIPLAAEPILMSFSIAFTQPTFQRILPLTIGAILTTGRRTVTAVLWTMPGLLRGHPSTYHRVFSRAVWSLWPLGRVLAGMILCHIPPYEPVLVPMDDTTAQHRGKHVYGKGCHHDAVRSSHSHVVFRWGHRWVVLAISVKLPFTCRRRACPPKLWAGPPPEQKSRMGRPRIKGRKLPTPREVVAHAQLIPTTVSWYGGSDRRVELTSGTGHWYKSGQGLVAVRWVFVHDVQGTHRDEYYYTTDISLSARRLSVGSRRVGPSRQRFKRFVPI